MSLAKKYLCILVSLYFISDITLPGRCSKTVTKRSAYTSYVCRQTNARMKLTETPFPFHLFRLRDIITARCVKDNSTLRPRPVLCHTSWAATSSTVGQN